MGQHYPVRHCSYAFSQATDSRGRVLAKTRHGQVELVLDVPHEDALLDWAAAPAKPLAGRVVFFETKGGAARETLSWEAGHCVGYREEFEAGNADQGAYRCFLTVAAPELTMAPGGPAAYVRPAAREHGSPLAALVPLMPPLPAALPLNKQGRYDARMLLMQRAGTGLAATPDEAAQTALTRLARNNVAVERARLSGHVYSSTAVPPIPEPEGWHMLDPSELAKKGVSPEMLFDPKSNFKAALYESSFERPPKLVIAYKGTENFFGNDGRANVLQGAGLESKQYNMAMKLADAVTKKTDPLDVETTGHSLGGGLASAASVVTGTKSYTFNSAGLHANTVGREPYGVSRQEMLEKGALIDAYRSTSDPLSNLQMASVVTRGVVLPKALGIPHVVTPAPQWQKKLSGFLNPGKELWERAMDGHGVNPQMVEHIEHEKDQDTATLTRFITP